MDGMDEKKEKKYTWKLFVGILLGVLLTLAGVVFYRGYIIYDIPGLGRATIKLPTYDLFHKPPAGELDTGEIDRKIGEIEYYLDNEYYYEADKEAVTEGIYRGMIDAMGEQDAYSSYFTRKEYQEEMSSIGGVYVGIGVTVSLDEETGGLYVESVTIDGPAEEAGIRNKDIIIKADDVDLRGMELSEATADHIKGEEGTNVKITVLRNGSELEFTCLRKKLTDKSVYASVFEDGGKTYGYMYVKQFLATTIEGFKEAIDDFEKKKADGVVIDLRSNPGGDMNVALDMLDYILPDDDGRYVGEEISAYKGKTLLLTIEMKKTNPTRYFAIDGHSSDLPIVILTDDGSASASEIFTGVMRCYGYRSVGLTTYGKGIVQSVRMLYDMSGIKYTSGEYVLPSGEKIHKKGITPDVSVEPSEEMEEKGIDITAPDPVLDNQLAAAVKLLRGE